MLLDSIDKDPKLVLQCGLSPLVLPELIEHNTIVASHMLLKLLPSS